MTQLPLEAKGSADLTDFIASFAAAGTVLSSFATLAAGATTAGVALAAIALIPAVDAAADFQAEMVKLNTLVGISTELMEEFVEAILALAPAVGIGPEELAKAMFAITSGGIRDSVESMELLEQSAKASALGLGDVTTIARVSTAVMQAFADQNLTASEAVDIMVGTVREGNLVADELPNAFGRVIGIAGQMGVSFSEVGTFMATFTRLGVSAEISATSLRSALFAILNPGKEARDTFDEIGLSVEEMRRRIADDGLTEAMLFLLEATDGNLDVLSDIIPNIRAMSGVLGVYARQAEQVVEIQDNMNNMNGVTNEGFAVTEKTLKQTGREIVATIETIAVAVGRNLLPSTTIVAEAVNNTLKATLNFGQGMAQVAFDFSDAFVAWRRGLVGIQTDASDLEQTLTNLEPRFQKMTDDQLAHSAALSDMRQDQIGLDQVAGVGDPGDNNRAMNQFIAISRRLREIIAERAIESLRLADADRELADASNLVALRTESMESATQQLLLSLQERALKSEGLSRQVIINRLEAQMATDTERALALSYFDTAEAMEEQERKARSLAKAIAEAQRINEAADAIGRRRSSRVARARQRRQEREAAKQAAIDMEVFGARLEVQMERQQRIMDAMSREITDYFATILRGTDDASEAFSEMITNMIAEWGRLKTAGIIEGALNAVFFPIPEAPGAFRVGPIDVPNVSIPGVDTKIVPIITGGNQAGFSSGPIVNQTVVFAPNLIDGQSGSAFFRKHSRDIAQIVGESVRRSTSFSDQLRGR